MGCSDIQLDLGIYSDGKLDPVRDARVRDHLQTCPVCRQVHSELLEVQNELRQLSRIEISDSVRRSLKTAVSVEQSRMRNSWFSVGPDLRDWLEMRLMPYTVGLLASLFIGASFLALLPSGIKQANLSADPSSTMLAASRDRFDDTDSFELSPAAYARTRASIANESPSINPQGALVALTKSLVRGSMRDEEVVVVAEVFGNGLAQITEVIEPTRDHKAMNDLARAMDTDPSYAPFVPAVLDNRSDSVKVVLRFQSVNVRADHPPRRR